MSETSLQSSEKIFGKALLERADVDAVLPKGRYNRFYALLLIVLPLFLLVTLRAAGKPLNLGFYGLSIGYGALLLAVQVFSRRRAVGKVLEGKSASELDARYELDDEGYAVITPSSHARHAWQAVHHFREVTSAFLIFTNPVVHTIMPKRAFAEQDVPRVRSLLQTRVKAKASRQQLWTFVVWVLLVAGFVLYYAFFRSR